jgi:hypothetical protein
MTTITAHSTITHTIMACPADYPNCPENAKFTTTATSTGPAYTTVIPVSSSGSSGMPAMNSPVLPKSSSPAVAKPVESGHSNPAASVIPASAPYSVPIAGNNPIASPAASAKPISSSYTTPAAPVNEKSSSSAAPIKPTATGAMTFNLTSPTPSPYVSQFTGSASSLRLSGTVIFGAILAILLL